MSPSCGKCMRPGPLTRNGYLNFLREFRKCNCGLSPTETVRQGAKKWRCMSRKDKQKYIDMARCAPKKVRRRRCGRR